jgi:exopolysaccharide biosynthesis polyprenyl glycosylphosphotransferase
MSNDDLRIQQALFAVLDALAITCAFALALSLYDPATSIEHHLAALTPSADGLLVALTVGTWLTVFHAAGLYRMRNGGRREFLAIVQACSIAAAMLLLLGFVAHVRISRITFTLTYLFSMPCVALGRALARSAIRHLHSHPRIAIPLVIQGFNPTARYLCDQILDDITPYEPVGFIEPGSRGCQYRGLPVFGDRQRLAQLAELYPGLETAIAFPSQRAEEIEESVATCERLHLGWWLVPSLGQSLTRGFKVELLGNVPVIGRRPSNIEGLNYAIKRGLDLVAGTLLLLGAAPLIAAAAIAIYLDDGGPVLFRQTRVGTHGKLFQLLKLRTMKVAASSTVHQEYVQCWIRGEQAAGAQGAPLYKLSEDARITRVGRWLRRFSIDELPQFVNVIRGDMSLIGPRPALPYELSLYESWHRGRLEGPPGLTGLWQVSGRNQLSFDEMVRLDVQYLEDWSLAGDLKILFRTLPVLLRGSGV